MAPEREVPLKDVPAGFLKELKAWAAGHDTLHLILSRDRYASGDGETGDTLLESVWWEEAPALAHLERLRKSANEFTELTLVPLKLRLGADSIALSEGAGNFHLPPILRHLMCRALLDDLRQETGSVLEWGDGWQLASWHAPDCNPDLDAALQVPDDPILKTIDPKFRKHGLFLVSFFHYQLLRPSTYFGTLKTQRDNAKRGWGKLEDLLKKHLNPEDLAAPVRLLPYLRKFLAANEGVTVYTEGGQAYSVADCLKKYIDELERRPEVKALGNPPPLKFPGSGAILGV